MDGSVFERGAGGSAVPAGANWMFLNPLRELRRSVDGRRHSQQLAIETQDGRPVRPAQPDRTFGQGFEHRVEIEGRTAYDFQHLRRRGLLLQRLCEVVGALAQFGQQPRVLDGDDGLGGEIL